MPLLLIQILILDQKKVTKNSIKTKTINGLGGTVLDEYLGFKITLVLDYDTKISVLFLLSGGSPHDTKMVPLILKELKRRKLISTGDEILFDGGYCSYYNNKIALET